MVPGRFLDVQRHLIDRLAATIITLAVAFASYYRTVLDYVGYAFLAVIVLFFRVRLVFPAGRAQAVLEERKK